MIDELQRAVRDAQFGNDFTLLVHYGVALRVPGAGAAIDPDNEARMT